MEVETICFMVHHKLNVTIIGPRYVVMFFRKKRKVWWWLFVWNEILPVHDFGSLKRSSNPMQFIGLFVQVRQREKGQSIWIWLDLNLPNQRSMQSYLKARRKLRGSVDSLECEISLFSLSI